MAQLILPRREQLSLFGTLVCGDCRCFQIQAPSGGLAAAQCVAQRSWRCLTISLPLTLVNGSRPKVRPQAGRWPAPPRSHAPF